MASGFSFGFSSDDIDANGDDHDEDMPDASHSATNSGAADLAPVKFHSLDEMLSTLPSTLSCSHHTISTNPALRLPRRELFDIRAQLLAEADVSDARSTAFTEGLTSDDIKPRLYEGGFKTWECSIDLARLVANENLHGLESWENVIELGAGTALPSCVVLQSLLARYPPTADFTIGNPRRRTLVLADYNEHVLTHASIPNFLLTFASAYAEESGDTNDDVDITEELLLAFQNWLSRVNLKVVGVSGAWGQDFTAQMKSLLGSGPRLIFASETIYQPDSLQAFTDVLINLLGDNQQSSPMRHRALVAAKKVYFGVGGGIDEFLACLRNTEASAEAIWDAGGKGVGRVILEVRSNHDRNS